jgi:type I restriction enzyme S subunit
VNLPRYPKYKPSGVDWLGEVPEHWEICQLRRIARLRYGDALATESREDGEVEVFGSNGVVGNHNTANTAAPAVIVGRKGSYGKVVWAENGGFVIDTAFATDGKSTAAWLRWLFYALQALHLDAFSQDTGVPGLPREAAYERPLSRSPLPEQRAIADFLDRETGRIDALVGKKRELIARLKERRAALITRAVTRGLDPSAKLKASGVEWLGMVPEGWEVPPFYTRYKVELGKMLDEARITGDHLVPYLRNVDVQWDTINLEDLPEMDILPHEYERYTLRKGDLVVCEGGEVGRAAIFEGSDRRVGFQKALHRLRPVNSKEVPRYTFYVLCAAAQLGVFVAEGNPNTIPHLTGEKLRRYRFPCPPLAEQRAIADHLDRETGKLDRLTASVEAAIERLHEYRAALITAAVTGKIDVRGTQAKEAA